MGTRLAWAELACRTKNVNLSTPAFNLSTFSPFVLNLPPAWSSSKVEGEQEGKDALAAVVLFVLLGEEVEREDSFQIMFQLS
jgi:hypothetical protein